MTPTTTAIAAGMLALAAVALPTGADAGCNGCGVAAGSAIANAGPYPGYAVVPGYAPYPAYAAAAPIGCPGGYWARRSLVDRFGNVVGFSRPRFFCPW
jgi:hypothetical protein